MNRSESIFQHPQRLGAAGVVLLVGIPLASCEVPQTAPEAASHVQAVPAPAAAVPPDASRMDVAAEEKPNLGGAIKEGMSYAELRKAMDVHGWKPVTGEFCLVNTVGQDYKAFCAEHPDSHTCGYCRQLPGLVRWSADGHVLLLFEHSSDRKQLEVGMYGELENWKYNAPDTMLGVSGWRYHLVGGG